MSMMMFTIRSSVIDLFRGIHCKHNIFGKFSAVELKVKMLLKARFFFPYLSCDLHGNQNIISLRKYLKSKYFISLPQERFCELFKNPKSNLRNIKVSTVHSGLITINILDIFDTSGRCNYRN